MPHVVETSRAPGTTHQHQRPAAELRGTVRHRRAPQSEHPMVAAGPVPMAPLTSPSAASRGHVRSHVVETIRAPWHNPPASAPRSRAPRHCRFPGCTAPPHVGCRVRFCFDHCASPRCSRSRGSVPAPHPNNAEAPVGAPLGVASCRRGLCTEPVHRECSTGYCNFHCTSRRCGYHAPQGNCQGAVPMRATTPFTQRAALEEMQWTLLRSPTLLN